MQTYSSASRADRC